MGMTQGSRDRIRESHRQWLAWYNTLSPTEQRNEQSRIAWSELRFLLGGILIVVFS